MQENLNSLHKNGQSMRNYNIANHIIAIDFGSTDCSESLIPSFTPFSYYGKEKPLLTVRLVEVFPTEDDTIEIGIFDVGGCDYGVYRRLCGGYQIRLHDSFNHLCAIMQSDATFTHCDVIVFDGPEAQRHYGLNNCMMMAFAFATATLDTVLIHSSVILHKTMGYLMTAPSGTGKSTHTHLWYTNIPECELLNDDNPIIRIKSDGTAYVYGSPWSGKTACYRNIHAPIGGIVRIRQHSENIIRHLRPIEAFTILLPACSNMKWDKRIYNGICDSVSKLIQKVNIWELKCLPDDNAAKLCHDTICKECHI